MRNFFADVGMLGDDVEAIDDGPGPASAVMISTVYCILFVDAKFKLNDRNQARSMLIFHDVAIHDDIEKRLGIIFIEAWIPFDSRDYSTLPYMTTP